MKDFFKKFTSKEKLQTHLSDTIEVGFSPYGPLVAVSGSLSVPQQYVFVYNIALRITRESNKKQYQFIWFVFRPHQFKLGGFHGIDLKMPSKFMVTPNAPHHFNILFSDNDTFSYMKAKLGGLRKGWETYVQKSRQGDGPVDDSALFEAYGQRQDVLSLLHQVRDQCYWKPGKYEMAVVLMTQKAKQFFEVKSWFSLSDEDCRLIESNNFAILRDICRQPAVRYSFASPRIELIK